MDIEAKVTIKGDSCHIEINSPPQVPYFINSYEGNSYSGVYLGLMMFAQLPPPYNEGLYRCVSVNMGPHGTLCNAEEPAPHPRHVGVVQQYRQHGEAAQAVEGRHVPESAAARRTGRHERAQPAPGEAERAHVGIGPCGTGDLRRCRHVRFA